MFVWIVCVLLLALCVVGFLREPRRLRIGILLLAALSLIGLASFGTILDRLDDPYGETAAWLLLGIIAVGLLSLITLSLFLVYNGIIMLFRESRSVANMLSLLLGASLLGYIFLGFLAVLRNDARLAVWLLSSVPPLAYLGFVFSAFITYAWVYARLAPMSAGRAQAVIVLGSGLIGNRVTPLLAARLRKGRLVHEQLRRDNPEAKLVVSGGQGPDEAVPEAVAMARWLEEQHVPADDILQERESRTTEHNLLLSKEVLARQGVSGPVAVVTSNYHAFRAATLMRTVGLKGYSSGAPTARYFWPSAMIREFVALLRDHLRLNAAILVLLTLPFLLFSLSLLIGLLS